MHRTFSRGYMATDPGDSHNADGFSAVENEGYDLSGNRDGVVSAVDSHWG